MITTSKALGVALSRLKEKDWTAASQPTKEGLHGLHPYPARMHPYVAGWLIEELSSPDDWVLDPFCGSGGVLLEARKKGRNAVGIDINPLALLLSKAKTTPIDPDLLARERGRFMEKLEDEIVNLNGKAVALAEKAVKEINHQVEFWFKKDKVIPRLMLLREHIWNIENEKVRNFFLACFSLTVRQSSNTRGNEFKLYRIAEDKLKEHNPKPISIFFNNLNKGIALMEETWKEMKDVKVDVLFEDTRSFTLNKKVQLVVTSPPYGDSRTTVAYGQFSRYPALWCRLYDGWHPRITKEAIMKVDNVSLGGNGKEPEVPESKTLKATLEEVGRTSKDRAKDTALFFQDLNKSFGRIRKAMEDGGHFCIVTGNRTVARVLIPTDEIIVELGELNHFKKWDVLERKIPTKRIPWENAPENVEGQKGRTIAEEDIVILRAV